MNKQEIDRILKNLMKEGLTQGEAYVRLRRMFVLRLEHSPKGSAAEERFLRDLRLLDNVCLNR